MTDDLVKRPHAHAAIHSLAAECATERVFFKDPVAFGVFWLKALLWEPSDFQICRSKHPMEAARFIEEILQSNGEGFFDACSHVRCEIAKLDDFDGWPTDEVLSVINSVCIAADIGFDEQCRWLAEAATHTWRFVTQCHNYNDTIAVSMTGWMRRQFERCCAQYEAADRIQELKAEVELLRGALQNVIEYVPDGACESSGFFAADFARALSDAEKVLSERPSISRRQQWLM